MTSIATNKMEENNNETLHQVKLRHRNEVKALKATIEKKRKEATRGLKGKQKKLAISELKAENRKAESDLLNKHKLELEKKQIEIDGDKEDTMKVNVNVKNTTTTATTTNNVNIKKENGISSNKPTTISPPPTAEKNNTVNKQIISNVQLEDTNNKRNDNIEVDDQGDEWKVVANTRKNNNNNSKNGINNNNNDNNNNSTTSMSAVMSAVHIDAEKSVRKLRISLISSLLRKFKAKRVCIIGTNEGNLLLESIRDNSPIVQQLCIIDNDLSSLNDSISTLKKGTFGNATSTIRPRKVALNISSYHVDAKQMEAIDDNIFIKADDGKKDSTVNNNDMKKKNSSTTTTTTFNAEEYSIVKNCSSETLVIPEYVHTLSKDKLSEFTDFVFDVIRPKILIVTTVNKSFNSVYNMHNDQVRYANHKFEFTNREFVEWCNELSESYGYDISHGGVGDAPTDFKAGVQSSLWAYFVYNEKKYLAKQTFGRFSNVLAKLIYEWPIVQFALAHDTGGHDTIQKVDKLFDDLEFNFLERWERKKNGKKNGDIYPDEIEPFLDEVLIEDLNIEAEDGSCKLLANTLVDIFNQAVKDDWKKADVILNMKIKNTVAKVEGVEGELVKKGAEGQVEGKGENDDTEDEIAVLPKLIWNHVIHDVVMQSSSDGTTARAVDKSGKHAQSKQKKHMKEMAKKNSKQNKSKVSYNRANS